MEHIAASTRSAAAIAYGRAVETADTAPRHQEITRTSASTSTVCELPAARTMRSHLFEGWVGGNQGAGRLRLSQRPVPGRVARAPQQP